MLFGKFDKIFGNFGAYTVNRMVCYSNRCLPNFDNTDRDHYSLTEQVLVLWLIRRVKTLMINNNILKKFLR